MFVSDLKIVAQLFAKTTLSTNHNVLTTFLLARANPKEIPPPAVTLPPALEAASISAASMYQLFSPSSATEFFFAGGSRSGVVVHFTGFNTNATVALCVRCRPRRIEMFIF